LRPAAGPALCRFPRNSVGSKHLKQNAVTGSKIRDGAVTSSKVKDGALLAKKFKPGELPAGPAGPQGAPGPSGPQGEKGDPGVVTGPAGGDLTGTYPAPVLRPSEAFREVGAPGQPPFTHNCRNQGGADETVAFYKDREGVVHLKGIYLGCSPTGDSPFTLPPGYRPASGKIAQFVVGTATVAVYGPGLGFDGQLFCTTPTCSLKASRSGRRPDTRLVRRASAGAARESLRDRPV
jgi:hypothetical protein